MTTEKKKGIKRIKESRIPEFKSREEEARFWDTHSFAEYWKDAEPVRSSAGKKLSRGIEQSYVLKPKSPKHLRQKRNGITQVVEIEGIGPGFSEKLEEAGVHSVEDLLEQGTSLEGRKRLAEKTGVSAKRILKWVNHADLFRIRGVAGQYAELLEKTGVDTVAELSTRNAEKLFEKMTEVNARFNLVRQVPEQARVAKWIKEAKRLPRKAVY